MKITLITKRRVALVLIAFSAVFSACKKENVVKDPTPAIRPRLTSLEQDEFNFMLFGYTREGYLNKFKMVNDYLTSEAHFGYNEANKPIAGTLDGYDLEFVYSGEFLDKVVFTPATPNPLMAEHYLKFSYSNNRVSQTIDYLKQGATYQPGAKHVYEYYDNGDMKAETYYYLVALPDQYEQIERNEYNYDEQINALQMPDEIAYTLYLNKSAHNIKRIVTFDASGGLSETKNYSLNYNQFGLPTNGIENTTYPDSPATNRTLKYSYQ